jgi:hypothetical protein
LEAREVHTGFWWEHLRERDHVEDQDIDGSIILKWIIYKWDGGMDWVDLAQDRDVWRALVYTVMNLRFPQNAGYSLTS